MRFGTLGACLLATAPWRKKSILQQEISQHDPIALKVREWHTPVPRSTLKTAQSVSTVVWVSLEVA